MKHSFRKQLKLSHDYSDSDIWEKIYKSVFPSFQEMIDFRHKGLHQSRGIDRMIVLSNSKTITVDEKVRFKAYEDIALEYLSVVEKNKAGWVCDPDKDCDYIAYAISPLGKGYLLPTLQLQLAWERNKEQWLSTYKTKTTKTQDFGGYTTAFCPVPAKVLFPALGSNLRFEFKPDALTGQTISGGIAA